MKIDAHHLVMIGVVGTGLYALWRLTQTSSSSPQTPSQLSTPTRPTPLNIPPGPLPSVPGPLPPLPTSTILFVNGSPLHLRPAAWYHGRLETNGQASPFSPSSSREQIAQGLASMGFGQVQVFMTPQEAAQDIFQPFALAGAATGTRWFRARWPLMIEGGYPTPTRPAALSLLWEAAPPAP
jgi:hypothetical protein